MTTLLFKPKQARRIRLALRRLDHKKVGHASHARISVKERNKFLHSYDLLYVPFRFIRGTMNLRRV